MPLYDFKFGDQAGPHGVERLAVSATDAHDAVETAISWAKNERRLSGNVNDFSSWPLVVLAGDNEDGHERGAVLFKMKDVRPNDWA